MGIDLFFRFLLGGDADKPRRGTASGTRGSSWGSCGGVYGLGGPISWEIAWRGVESNANLEAQFGLLSFNRLSHMNRLSYMSRFSRLSHVSRLSHLNRSSQKVDKGRRKGGEVRELETHVYCKRTHLSCNNEKVSDASELVSRNQIMIQSRLTHT